MASTSLEGLNTSIIGNSLMKDVGEEVFMPYLPSINTITAHTSNDGNVVSVNGGDFTSTSNITVEIPKYGYLSCLALDYGVASAASPTNLPTISTASPAHVSYANLEYLEVRCQGKKILGYSGVGIHHMLANYLTKSQYEAINLLSGDGARTRSVLVIPVFGALFDKKLALNTVLLDRMEIVFKFSGAGAPNSASGNLVHFWYHQVNPETEAKLRSELFSKGNRNVLMYDCQTYSISSVTSLNLTSQKLVRCHYVDEVITNSLGNSYNYALGSNATVANNAISQKVTVKAGGRIIYDANKLITATLGAVLNGKEVNNTRCLCVDYRNGILKGSSADYSSGLALRHLPQPTLEVSAFMTDGSNATNRLVVSEEAYVMVSLEANTGRVQVVAEN
jgi:hypothetical protein